jgi:hypothetical protein
MRQLSVVVRQRKEVQELLLEQVLTFVKVNWLGMRRAFPRLRTRYLASLFTIDTDLRTVTGNWNRNLGANDDPAFGIARVGAATEHSAY